MRKAIEDSLDRTGQAVVTSDFLNQAFPEPRFPTVEEMETAILSLIASPMVEDRGKIAHVFQARQIKQIEEFCKRNNCAIRFDYLNDNYIFEKRLERNTEIE